MKVLTSNINTIAKVLTIGFFAVCSITIIVQAITTGKGL